MAWIKVTDPLGHPIYLSVEQLMRIRPCIAGADFLPPSPDTKMQRDRKDGDLTSAKSIIDLVSGMQAVRETQDEIIERIKNAGKDEDKAAGV
jgi:hypothetical protein